VLAIGDLAAVPPSLHFSRAAKRFVDAITIYINSNPDLSDKINEEQGDNLVSKTNDRKILCFEKGPSLADVVIHFKGGESVNKGFLGHKAKTEPKGSFCKQLGLDMTLRNEPKLHPIFYRSKVTVPRKTLE
jgi:hypothetical protein